MAIEKPSTSAAAASNRPSTGAKKSLMVHGLCQRIGNFILAASIGAAVGNKTLNVHCDGFLPSTSAVGILLGIRSGEICACVDASVCTGLDCHGSCYGSSTTWRCDPRQFIVPPEYRSLNFIDFAALHLPRTPGEKAATELTNTRTGVAGAALSLLGFLGKRKAAKGKKSP